MDTTTIQNNIEYIWANLFKRPKGYVFRVMQDHLTMHFKMVLSTKEYAVGATISYKDAMDAKAIERTIKSMMDKIEEQAPINIPVAELRKALGHEPPEVDTFSAMGDFPDNHKFSA